MTTLSFLLSDYRKRVLSLLLLHPQNRYHVREIARLTNTSAGTLHRELSKLAEAQVLIRIAEGSQVYYQANTHFIIFDELASIVRKTSGLIGILANALAPLADRIEIAFIFGSFARGTDSLTSDIDVLIIGSVNFTDAATSLYSVQADLGREINPKVYNKVEWQKMLKSKNSFVREVLSKPKIFILGTKNDLQ